MDLSLSIDSLEELRAALAALMGRVGRWPGVRFADVRIVVTGSAYAAAQDGAPQAVGRDATLGFGVRVVAGRWAASGFYGATLGATDLPHLARRVERSLRVAYVRAQANALEKWRLRADPVFGPAIYATRLAPVRPVHARIRVRGRHGPQTVSLERLRTRAEAASQAAARTPQVASNSTALVTSVARRLFLSTEGALIDEESLFTQGALSVVAVAGGVPEEAYDYMGARAGVDALGGRNVRGISYEAFCRDLVAETVALAGAPWCPGTAKPATVVCDPHFVALLVHETSAGGHPAEADRVLKKEAGYAGRSYYYANPQENLLGKRIASPLVNIAVDTSTDSYGKTIYDDEGVRGHRTLTCKGGILVGLMHSRETAALLGAMPNGCMKATDPAYVPLVRMPNTYVLAGASSPQAILRSVRDGWAVFGHRTPSIAESRENFMITARRTYRVRNGRLMTLYRGGGLTGDTAAFWHSIDQVGTDLQVFGIPNCGKGAPMQTCPVGNGGPTLRGRARIVGKSR